MARVISIEIVKIITVEQFMAHRFVAESEKKWES